MPCDLHIHSTHSDGTLTPAALIAEAKRLGLTVALTDHNTVSGLTDFLNEARKQGVTAIPGIEISSDLGGTELHVVGLFIAPEHYAAIEKLMVRYHKLKEESNIRLIENLRHAGYAIDYASVQKRAAHSTPNRALIALELVEQGYVSSVQEAFDKLLKEEHGYYIPPERLTTAEAITFLRSIHALPVLAHPFLNLTEDALRAALPDLMEAGLVAMEVQHSTYDDETITRAKAVADEFGLLYSGGSDFHGEPKPDVRLGVGKGNLDVPEAYLEALATRSKTL